jgi:transposase
MEYRSKVIDHLGIVAGVCKEIHLAEEINRIVGVNDQQKVTTGDAVLAMVINALGFTSKPLYLFPGFMHNKPVELLVREDLKPEDFNDDTLGRALDRLYQNNPTQIFMHIALRVAKLVGVERKFLHLDTTTMSVHGEYESEDEMVPITITYGHPTRNGRSDLKQFIISLITLSQSDLPLWLDVLSGNASDKKHFPEVIKKFSKELAAGSGEEIHYVADAALYSEENVKEVSPLVKWISRVPENISEAKKLIQEADAEKKMTKSSLEGYRHQEHRSTYGGVEQKWLVVFSEKGYNREVKTLEKSIQSERKKIEKELWHLGNREFNRPEDALSAAQETAQGWKYHKLSGPANVTEVNKTGRRGRPAKNTQPPRKVYRVEAAFERDEERVDSEKRRRGKFIVATNDPNLDSDTLLEEYKGQQSVERGFRFLKDPLFFTSSVFLKKPQRIVSLVMIMTLSLLVYSVAQYKLRRVLEERGESVPDQKGKPTKRPTMRWVFQVFEGIHLLLEMRDDGEERIIGVLNLGEVHRKILALLGNTYEKIYLC